MDNNTQENGLARLDCLAALCRLKKASRVLCQEMQKYNYQGNGHRRAIALLKQEDSPFNCHRISKLAGKIQKIEDSKCHLRHRMKNIGKQITDILEHSNTLLSFHDKCQVIGRSHQAVAAEMVKACLPLNTSFYNMVTIYDLECASKYDPDFTVEDEYNPLMPLSAATNEHLLHVISKDEKLDTIFERAFNEMFPHLDYSEFQGDNIKNKPPVLRLL